MRSNTGITAIPAATGLITSPDRVIPPTLTKETFPFKKNTEINDDELEQVAGGREEKWL